MSAARQRARGARGGRLALTGAVLATGLLLDACLPRLSRARSDLPAPVDLVAAAWDVTLDSARAAITSRRPAHADSVLSAFRDRYAGMPQSAEALYWRALARLDLPAVIPVGVQAALADLDAYRATAAPAHLAEATVLRRALTQLDSARMTAATAVTSAERPQPNVRATLLLRDTLRVREEELQRARADAAAAQAELDRVRRRLAVPGRRPY